MNTSKMVSVFIGLRDGYSIVRELCLRCRGTFFCPRCHGTQHVDTRPHKPQSNSGQIYPLNVHGTVVYLTKGEDFAATWVFYGGLFCGIIGGAMWRSIQ